MKLVYIGELSGVIVPESGRETKRGAPFVCDDELGRRLMLGDPTRWREANAQESAALDLLLEAARIEAEEKQREEDAKLAAIMDPSTGGGGTGNDEMGAVEALSPVEPDPSVVAPAFVEIDKGFEGGAKASRKRKHEE